MNTTTCHIVRESEFKRDHEVYEGAPCDWSAERGATHTLWTGNGPGRGTRPAILKKTRLHVGIDEAPDGKIVWEVWEVRPRCLWPDVRHPARTEDALAA